MSRKSDRNVMSSDNLAKQIIELGQNKEFGKLQELIAKCETKLVYDKPNAIFDLLKIHFRAIFFLTVIDFLA